VASPPASKRCGTRQCSACGVTICAGQILLAAIESGHTGLVQLLVERGTPINEVCDRLCRLPASRVEQAPDRPPLAQVDPVDDETPLLHAVRQQHEGVVSVLLRLGADPNGGAAATTPLCAAAEDGC
jgi:hypothetical protein